MFALQILILVVAVITIVTWWQNRHKRKLYNELKSGTLKSWPIVGHAAYFFGSEEDCMKALTIFGETAKNCGGSMCVWFMDKLSYWTTDAEDAEYILFNCLEKDESVKVTRCVGQNVLFASVPIWRPRRKILAPMFTGKRLLASSQIHMRCGSFLADQLKSKVGVNFPLFDYVAAYSMDSIGETFLGTKLGAQRTNEHSFLHALYGITEVTGLRFLQPWLQNEFLFQFSSLRDTLTRSSTFLVNFVKQHVLEKREIMNRKQITSADDDRFESVLEWLLSISKQGKGFNEVELAEETLGLTMAATDTSVVGITCMFWLLAQHPEKQEKLYNELKEYRENTKKPLTGEDFHALKYLDCVIKESLRLFPPVPLVIRKVSQTLTLPSGRTLLPGMGAYVHVQVIQRSLKYWGPDPDEFRPERFMVPTHQIAFLPFSKGARNCLGMHYAQISMKAALVNVLSRYRLSPAPGTDKSIKLKFNITAKPTEKYLIHLEPRT